ncbi:ubiquitin-conjugating enzyme E2 J2-like [Oppia nitens]|uniref:ubiquitin-conjugating enzyme E2 J2-like n=1 Tax=Oppia nitens TaxID=1686743 RepID=UPI0023DC8D3D|nr:ubiquitin-conjugating enzyme E2 J2-like [Oppia nitens]
MSAPQLSDSKRLQNDYKQLLDEPIDDVWAVPCPYNIYECYYVLKGPSFTQFAGGLYFGRIMFPKTYPFNGPSIYMMTPSGRFRTANDRFTGHLISMEDHLWSACNTVTSVLQSLQSWMFSQNNKWLTEDDDIDTLSLPVFDRQQRQQEFAINSYQFNIGDPRFGHYFPQLIQVIETFIFLTFI